MLPVMLLSGGLATRMKPISETLPKSMLIVVGLPFIEHQLRLLKKKGITSIILCVGHLGKIIENYVGDGSRYQLKVQYSYDGEKLLGTGGAIKKALKYLNFDEPFFVLYGDSYLDVNFAEIEETWNVRGRAYMGLLTVFKNDNRWGTSNVVIQNNAIVKYSKKKQDSNMKYIDYGLGILRKHAFSGYEPGISFDLGDVYEGLALSGQLLGYEVFERFYEIGSKEGLLGLERKLSRVKAVFLDRDGVINPLVYNPKTCEYESPHYPEDFSVYIYVLKSLRLLKEHGFKIFVVSNQPSYAKGKATLENIKGIEKMLRDFSEENGCLIDDFYYCYHHPDGIIPEYSVNCRCRKPGTLFLEDAMENYDLDRDNCFFIGDSTSDIECGKAMGFRTIRINNERNTGRQFSCVPDAYVSDLYEAAWLVVNDPLRSVNNGL